MPKIIKNIPKMTPEQIDSFWSRVKIKGKNECWEWQGGISDGYGRVTFWHQAYRAQRIAWYLFNRRQPGNVLVCHTCDNPPCCNPAHLFLGTHMENNHDMQNKGRGRTPNLNGENHPMHKLTQNQVDEIRKLHTQGNTQQSLADKYGVSRVAIGHIVNFKTWTH